MHRVTEVSEFSAKKEMLLFDDNTFLVLYKGMYDRSGTEISDEEYEALFKQMLSYGKKRAMYLLLKKDHSRGSLYDKLSDDGFNDELIARIYDFLDSYHYLDDRRVAENYIRMHRNSKSRMELRFQLKKLKIPDEIAEQALEDFYVNDDTGYSGDDNSEDAKPFNRELDVIMEILRKRGITKDKIAELDRDEKMKIRARLYRKGFNGSDISKALQIIESDE